MIIIDSFCNRITNLRQQKHDEIIRSGIADTVVTSHIRDIHMNRVDQKVGPRGVCTYKKITNGSGCVEYEMQCEFDEMGRKTYEKIVNKDGDIFESEFTYDRQGKRHVHRVGDNNFQILKNKYTKI